MTPQPQIPLVPVAVYAKRRAALLASLTPGSVLVHCAAPEVIRSRDTDYPYRQDSDLLYLTGFPEPEAWLILSKDADGSCRELLLCRPKDELAEVWQGRRFGPAVAAKQFGLPALCNDVLEQELLQALNGKQTLVFAQGAYAQLDEKIFQTLQTLRTYPKRGYSAPAHISDLRPLTAELRLFKDEHEIALMREAGRISAGAHKRAMQIAAPGVHEYQLEAEIRHFCAMHGARQQAYNTIVGGGENGCILHYTDNNDVLKAGDLVLIDAGGELAGYAADITRTFPVNGKFTPDQAALYQVVLDAQYAACAAVKPGNSTRDTVAAAIAELTRGLRDLGILHGDLPTLIAEQACKKYFIHGLGHWLGLDVHDVGAYKVAEIERPFEPGMVLTIEPGLYIPTGSDCDPRWWGMAVRIEDDLLVIKDGHLNLTDTVPKTIAEIEALMAGRSF